MILEHLALALAHDVTPEGFRCSYSPSANWGRKTSEQIELCIEFLSEVPTVRTPKCGSYGLKHVIERVTGTYIANGALILAALSLGIPVKRRRGTPNADIAIASENKWPARWRRKRYA